MKKKMNRSAVEKYRYDIRGKQILKYATGRMKSLWQIVWVHEELWIYV